MTKVVGFVMAKLGFSPKHVPLDIALYMVSDPSALQLQNMGLRDLLSALNNRLSMMVQSYRSFEQLEPL